MHPKSAIVQIKFKDLFLCTHQPKTIFPVLSVIAGYHRKLASKPRTQFDLLLYGITVVSSQQSTCFLKKLQQSFFFHINPIQTVAKKVISTIFSKKVNSVILQSVNFLTHALLSITEN